MSDACRGRSCRPASPDHGADLPALVEILDRIGQHGGCRQRKAAEAVPTAATAAMQTRTQIAAMSRPHSPHSSPAQRYRAASALQLCTRCRAPSESIGTTRAVIQHHLP